MLDLIREYRTLENAQSFHIRAARSAESVNEIPSNYS